MMNLRGGTLTLLLACLCARNLLAAQEHPSQRAQPLQGSAGSSTVIYVARRGWHIDIGFAASAIQPPLNSLTPELPGAQYLFFGFGDERYLLAKNHNAPVLLEALWPGRGMMLVTGLVSSPQDAFGAPQVITLEVTQEQMRAAQAFIWHSFTRSTVPARGPYDGSLYFAATPRYSGFHTCNTWAAETLKSAALPIHSGGVVLAGQLWVQVRRAARKQAASLSCTAAWCRPGK